MPTDGNWNEAHPYFCGDCGHQLGTERGFRISQRESPRQAGRPLAESVPRGPHHLGAGDPAVMVDRVVAHHLEILRRVTAPNGQPMFRFVTSATASGHSASIQQLALCLAVTRSLPPWPSILADDSSVPRVLR